MSRLRAEWLDDHDKPTETTLRRWLERTEKEHLVERTGTGRRRDAFRYGLAGRTDLLPDLPPMRNLREQEYDDALRVREADADAAEMIEQNRADRVRKRGQGF
ncbi:hypothetical protein BH11PLA2_BH11PLA2_37220 [soil metagenome]